MIIMQIIKRKRNSQLLQWGGSVSLKEITEVYVGFHAYLSIKIKLLTSGIVNA